MEELLKKAKELGLVVKDDITEDELKELIKTKEDENIKKEDSFDKDHWKKEAQAAFDARDTAKKERRALQEKLTKLEEKLTVVPNTTDIDDLKKKVDELTSYKTTVEQEREELDLQKKTDIEKAEISFRKEMKKLEESMNSAITKSKEELSNVTKKLEEKDSEIKTLRKSTLKSQIIEAATKHKAYNPSQIVTLLSDRFEYDGSLDKFSYLVKDSKGKLVDDKTVEETVKEFLENEENDNLVRSDLKGTGLLTKGTEKVVDTTSLKKGTSKKYNPNDEDLKKEADFEGMPVDAWITIKEKKDAKLEKIRGV